MTRDEPDSTTAQAARGAEQLVEWLVHDANRLEMTALVDALGWRLRTAGWEIDRLTISLRLLDPQHLAASIIWRPNEPIGYATFDWDERDQGMYERSPFKVAHDTGRWLELDLDRTPDTRFGVVPDLKEAGFRHYLAIPVAFPNGYNNTITLASKSPAGFSEEQRQTLRQIVPPLALLMELKMLHRSLHDVLATYVGKGPADKIVNGTVHRGEVTEINAAIFLADLRGFTAMSTQMPPQATADVLNRYYDAVVPPIEANGGEVLKFIGDAVLAIFPATESGLEIACRRALTAASQALDQPIEPVRVDGREETVRFGVAVHIGDVVYGNVGSGQRLDFTVVGRDVNVVARMSSLCSQLGRPFLVSSEVADIAGGFGIGFRSHGAHMVRGLADPLPVFEPLIAPPDLPAMHHEDEVSVGPTLM